MCRADVIFHIVRSALKPNCNFALMGSVFTPSFTPYELVKWLRGFNGVVKNWVGDGCYPFGSRGSDSDDGPIGALLVPVSPPHCRASVHFILCGESGSRFER